MFFGCALYLSAATLCSALIQMHDTASFVSRTNRALLFPRTVHSLTSSNWIEPIDDDEAEDPLFATHRLGGGPPIKVGIAGAGAVAFGTAAILSKNGHDVMLWSPSGKSTRDLQAVAKADDDDDQGILFSTGTMKHEFAPRIAANSQQLVNENSVIIIALPANGHKMVFDEIAPHLLHSSSEAKTTLSSISEVAQRHKHIIISSHASLGALYLSKLLLQDDEQGQYQLKAEKSVPRVSKTTITAWGTTICTARRPSGRNVDIKSIRKSVDLCTIPRDETSSGLYLCQRLFPDTEFRSRDGLLAISLSNVNPQNHLGMALGNISRMERGEQWYQFQNTTPKIGAFLEALDRERLDISDALGVQVKTIHEHFSLSFHVPMTGSISDMCQRIYADGNDVFGPDTSESRYVTEDVPFGLALTVVLGRLVDKPAVLHESGLAICSAMYGEDFAEKNDLLKALDLRGISLEELKEAAYTGRLPRVKRDASILSFQESRTAVSSYP